MSGTNANSPPGSGGAGGDPSMEDILASIRRILAEDEPVPDAGTAVTAPAPVNGGKPPVVKEDVLVLDASMLAPAEPVPVVTPQPQVPPVGTPAAAATPVSAKANGSAAEPTVAEDRPLIIRNTLPCFEEAVRAALQPVIQQWAESTLPMLVERMVRTEVERVVGGAVQ